MASFKTAKKKVWGARVPYGTWISLSYDEAKAFTSDAAKSAIAEALAPMGPYALAAAVAVIAQQEYIRTLNEKSDHKGVRLLFVWVPGIITSVERLGFSPEVTVTPVRPHGSTSRKPVKATRGASGRAVTP